MRRKLYMEDRPLAHFSEKYPTSVFNRRAICNNGYGPRRRALRIMKEVSAASLNDTLQNPAIYRRGVNKHRYG